MSGKSELKIFDDHPPQVVVEQGCFEEIHSRGSIENDNAIEFFIPASNVDYLDLNDTLLTVRVKVAMADGSTMKGSDAIPPNFFLHALFSNVSLTLNDTPINNGALYPYKSSIESLLCLPADARESQLCSVGFNDSTTSRQKWVQNSVSCELSGRLHLDFFNQPKYLIPGVNVRILMTKSSADFVLSTNGTQANGTWKFLFEKAVLYVRRVKVHPAIIKAHSIGLETKNALYPYTASKVVTFNIPTGSSSFFIDNLFSSNVLPKLVVVGLIHGSVLAGTLQEPVFKFSHYDVTKIDLLRDGQSIPYRSGYTCDFSQHYTDMYVRSILQNMNILGTDKSCALHHSKFTNEYCLFVFNLAPDFDIMERQQVQDSNLRLDLRFKKALTHALSVIAYACYDTTLQITKEGNIIRDGHV